MQLTAIVLAAGASRRLGRPKQLEPFEGEPLIHRAARTAREVARTIIVIPDPASGFVAPAICAAMRDALADLDVTIVENTEAAEGMASSIRTGVSACSADVLLTLCDQPHITSAHLRALAEVGSPIAATSYGCVRGVPAFFASALRPELLALRGDIGARFVIESNRDRAVGIPFALASVDVD